MNRVFLSHKLIEDYSKLEKYKITIKGDNNSLYLNETKGEGKIWIFVDGNNCIFKIGKNNTIKNDISINFWDTRDRKPDNSRLIIGNENFFNGTNNVFICPLDKKIQIGDRNLFAGDICFWGRNDHIIYDNKTHKRINNDEDIVVGSSNWICQKVTFLPKAILQDYSVIAYGSILNKKIKEKHVIVAGVPAKITKRGINWSIASDYERINFKNNIV